MDRYREEPPQPVVQEIGPVLAMKNASSNRTFDISNHDDSCIKDCRRSDPSGGLLIMPQWTYIYITNKMGTIQGENERLELQRILL